MIMVPTRQRISWIVLGTIGLWWVLVGFVATGDFIVSKMGVGASVALLVLCFVSILKFTVLMVDDDQPLWESFTDSAHRIAATVGLVDSRVVVEGAIAHDGIVWVCTQFRDGTSAVSHRACPSCRLRLVERHATTGKLNAETATDGGTTVNALSCPHCAYAVPGQRHQLTGADAALSRFDTVIEEMRGAEGTGFEQWRRIARDSIGTKPTPADVWDEYTKSVDDGAIRRRTGGQLGDGERRAIDTYPAFAELKQERNVRERLVDFFPEPLDIAADSLFRTEYLEEKERLKRRRDTVRAKYAPLRDDFFGEHRTALSSLTEARTNRSWPDERISERRLAEIKNDIDALTDVRKDHNRFLTGAEYDTITRISTQFEEATSYLRTAKELRKTLGGAREAVDTFEAEFGPYENYDRYMENRVETRLTSSLADASDAVETLRTTLQSISGPVPDDASRRVSELESVVDDRARALDDYESSFVEHEVEAHSDVFETEHGPLNEKQTLAVVRDEPHNLVDASAGTGKTLTLTRRILYLYEKGVALDDIVAITFTGDAAEEMRTRVADAIGGVDTDRLNIMTFHKLARDIVSRSMKGTVDRDRLENGTEDFLDRAFAAADELRRLAPEAMRSFQTHRNELPKTDPTEFDSGSGERAEEGADERITDVFKKARNFDRTPEELRRRTDRGDETEYQVVHAVAALLEVYAEFGESRDHPIDHDHTIERAEAVVTEFSDRYEDRFDHVLVDEFQDVSRRQLDFVEALLGPETHLFAVGDDWQSIYGFRGSKPAFFREFDARFDETSRTTLEVNYRCSPAVVRASSSLMLDSDEATTKQVRAFSSVETTPVLHRLGGPYTDRHGVYVADLAEELVEESNRDDDVMVLARTNSEKKLIVDHLRANGIPTGTTDGGAEADEDENGSVVVQTVHGSKGTEARFVVIANAVDDESGGIPMKPIEKREDGPVIDETIDHYEEERRLFYVAMTRAEVELHVVARSNGVSRYVKSLSDHFTVVDDGVDRIEGKLTDVSQSPGPTKLTVDCGSYDAHIAAWDADLLAGIDVGGIYRFCDLTPVSSGFDEDLKLTVESNVVRLD